MIVVFVIIAAVVIFALLRALFAPRPPYLGQGGPYVDQMPGPVYVDEPNPIAGIATAIAAEVVIDTALGAVDAFDSGPTDFQDPGIDPGFGDGF